MAKRWSPGAAHTRTLLALPGIAITEIAYRPGETSRRIIIWWVR